MSPVGVALGLSCLMIVVPLAVVGLLSIIEQFRGSARRERRRLDDRTRRAEQEIIDIGRWQQEAILAALRRRTGGRLGTRPSAPPTVIDGEWIE